MAEIAKALGDPIRLQLVDVLRKHAGKVCVCELVPLFDISQPTLSHHLKKLRDAGIVGLRAARAVGLLLRQPRRAGGAVRMAEPEPTIRETRPRALRRGGDARRARLPRLLRARSRLDRPSEGDQRLRRRALRRRGRRRPDAAVQASLGCGVPTAVADLHEGETVLDLGSGAGADVLISARRVGPTGKAIGLDMTDEMLDLARANAAEAGVDERRVRQGLHRGHPAAGRVASTWSSPTA